MIYVFNGKDKAGGLQLRMDTRPEHVAYLTALNEAGTLVFAGPYLDGDGNPCGSLVAIHADSLEAAKAIIAADPFSMAGLFASVEVQPWNWVFNKPAGA